MVLAFLVRCATVAMMLVDSLVAAVAGAAGLCLQRQAARLEECKIVRFAGTKRGGQQTAACCVDYELGFAGVALFLAAVVLLLFF